MVLSKVELFALPENNLEKIEAKPFLKWAGGKTQLLEALEARLPVQIRETRVIEKYVEPFVGGGAVFFFLKRNYLVKKAFLIDINRELILTYKVVQKFPLELINKLANMEKEFFQRYDAGRREYYYRVRREFNEQGRGFDYSSISEKWISRAAQIIFLNKTCYNGLFRMNRKGEFNVPFGRYKNPRICDAENILAASKALAEAEIICGDFSVADDFIEKGTLVYFDPPYRPLSSTANFTGYTENGFTDDEQKRLAEFFRKMHARGAWLLLSNSDPKNVNADDDFFERLYDGFVIERVEARRYINRDAKKRGEIREVIIRNYEIEG